MIKVYQRQNNINGFGEKTDVKSNWIETTECYPSYGQVRYNVIGYLQMVVNWKL